jgi:hypothetical protein
MPNLTAHDLLTAWERGLAQPPARRALELLAAVRPEVPPRWLGELSLGRRDAALLAIREALVGRSLACLADCPGCGVSLELDLDTSALRAADPSEFAPDGPTAGPSVLALDGIEVRWRPIRAADLLEIEPEHDPAEARRELLAALVVEARRGDEPLAPADLPAAVVEALERAAEAADPLAWIGVKLRCPDCGLGWTAELDVAAAVWSDVDARARRLLAEVHALALAYGWSEAEILSLSTPRRRAYLELLGA